MKFHKKLSSKLRRIITKKHKKEIFEMTLEEIEQDIKKSRTQNIVVYALILSIQSYLLWNTAPSTEYVFISVATLGFIWIPFLITAYAVFLFSPISRFAADRFMNRKLFFTLSFLVVVPSFLTTYLFAGQQIAGYSLINKNKAFYESLDKSGYVQHLPPDRKIPTDIGTDLSGQNKNYSDASDLNKNREYVVVLDTKIIGFVSFLAMPGTLTGIAFIFLLMWANCLDTLLAAWRVKKGIYGFNSLEAKEITEFIWKFEDHRGGKGPWYRGPLWVRGYNKSLTGVAGTGLRNV